MRQSIHEGTRAAAQHLVSSAFRYPRQQIRRPVSGQNHPPISNVFGNNNIAYREHGSGCYRRAIPITRSRCTAEFSVLIGKLRRNLKALFCPSLKACTRKFGELAPLKLLMASERGGLVS